MTALIPGLAALSDRYDVLLCDVWGVIHNGREHFPLACEALSRWKAERGPVVLISNSPRTRGDFTQQLRRLGVPDAAWSDLVTSGDVSRALLAPLAPGPAWTIGAAPSNPLYEGLGLTFTGPESAAFIACVGPDNDDYETPEDYRDRLALCAERGLPMVCVNPDKVVHRGDSLIYCGGALADLYVELGGEATMAGKPHAPIYALALEKAAALRGHPIDHARVLCIGDGLPTDVAGAGGQGLDCLFVAGGIHREVLEPGAPPNALEHLLAEHGVKAAWAIPSLCW